MNETNGKYSYQMPTNNNRTTIAWGTSWILPFCCRDTSFTWIFILLNHLSHHLSKEGDRSHYLHSPVWKCMSSAFHSYFFWMFISTFTWHPFSNENSWSRCVLQPAILSATSIACRLLPQCMWVKVCNSEFRFTMYMTTNRQDDLQLAIATSFYTTVLHATVPTNISTRQ